MRLAVTFLHPAALLALALGAPAQAEDRAALLILRNDSGSAWQFAMAGLGFGLDPGHGTLRVTTLLANGTSKVAVLGCGAQQAVDIPAGARVAFRFQQSDEQNCRGGNLVRPKDNNEADYHPLQLENRRLRLLDDGPFKLVGERELVLLPPSPCCAIL